uniref:Uncharacterized protein n=1 Tax=Timema douglasi TaxID=61478 RepID=A0A7R8Z757_TIMDO|nr:unnamed protein product [Timema douglasi]
MIQHNLLALTGSPNTNMLVNIPNKLGVRLYCNTTCWDRVGQHVVREEEAKSLGAKTGLHTRTTPISTQPQHCRSVQG